MYSYVHKLVLKLGHLSKQKTLVVSLFTIGLLHKIIYSSTAVIDDSTLVISPDQQSSVPSTSSCSHALTFSSKFSSEVKQIKGIVEHLGSHQQIA